MDYKTLDERNYERLMKLLNGISLTEDEKGVISKISEWDTYTVDSVVSILGKLKRHPPKLSESEIEEIEKSIKHVRSTMALEGMDLSEDVLNIYRKNSLGVYTEEETVKELNKI